MKAHPHFDGRKFRNAIGPATNGLRKYLRWAASRKRKPWPKRVENQHRADIPKEIPADAIAATFIGHSTFLLQFGGFHLLTDPVFSERCGPFNLVGPRRTRAPAVRLDLMPRIDAVLLSHNHYDHLDVATLRQLQRACDPLLITGLGNERFLRRNGFRHVVELDWWQEHRGSGALQGLEVTFTPAQHFSSRHLWDRDETLWGGFAMRAAGRQVYFVGDSGYGEHFPEIGRRLGAMDMALVPIGAYEPRWFMQRAHVNPGEAVQIHLDVQSRLSIAMHFGTFHLTDEGMDEPAAGLREALQARNVPAGAFVVPEFGETVKGGTA